MSACCTTCCYVSGSRGAVSRVDCVLAACGLVISCLLAAAAAAAALLPAGEGEAARQ
jgi:hypothetical protein